MKKILLSLLILSFVSCDDTFNPYGEYQEEYSLYCVLNKNSSLQFLTVRKSIPNASLSFVDTINASVPGATVKIFTEDSVFSFKESVELFPDENKQPLYYYLSNFSPQKGKTYKLEASINNDIFLTCSIQAPSVSISEKKTYFILTDLTGNGIENDTLSVFDMSWETDAKNLMFLPRVYLNYYELDGPNTSLKSKEIPLFLLTTTVGLKLSYPTFIKTKNQRFLLDAFELMINELKYEGVDKDSIIISDFTASLYIVSEELARYYNSINAVSGGNSFRGTPAEYTNLKGGSGFLGYKELIKEIIRSKNLRDLVEKSGFRYYYQNFL